MLTRFWQSKKEFALSLPALILISILASKFYFLWGFSPWPRPAAPIEVVLLRDLICWGGLAILAWVSRSQFSMRKMRFFAFVFCFGLLISLIQFYEGKSFSEWSQHYLRNTLLPMLFYPVGLAVFRRFETMRISEVLFLTTLLNLVVSLLQLWVFPSMMWEGVRPTGLIGDPLILSLFILFGCVTLFNFSWWMAILVFPAAAVILVYTSSLSAIVSFALGLLAMGIVLIKSQKPALRQVLKALSLGLGGFLLLLAVGFMLQSELGSRRDFLLPKASALLHSVTCQGEGCQKHWSYEGRITSNRLALDLCSSGWKQCLIGDYQQTQLKKVDSTVASLILNWGLLFALAAVAWVLWHVKLLWKSAAEIHFGDPSLWALIFFSGLFFSLFNSLMYKYPLNILFYLSMAFIASRGDRGEKTNQGRF